MGLYRTLHQATTWTHSVGLQKILQETFSHRVYDPLLHYSTYAKCSTVNSITINKMIYTCKLLEGIVIDVVIVIDLGLLYI